MYYLRNFRTCLQQEMPQQLSFCRHWAPEPQQRGCPAGSQTPCCGQTPLTLPSKTWAGCFAKVTRGKGPHPALCNSLEIAFLSAAEQLQREGWKVPPPRLPWCTAPRDGRFGHPTSRAGCLRDPANLYIIFFSLIYDIFPPVES